LIAGLKISNHDINISNSSLNSSVPTGKDLSSKIKDERNDPKRIDLTCITSAERQIVNFSDIAFTERSACPSQDRVLSS
jgi:hypothetical protein